MRHDNFWWGWGARGEGYPLADRDGLIVYLESRLGKLTMPAPEVPLDSVRVPPSSLLGEELKTVAGIVGQDGVVTRDRVRLAYSFGKSYKDLVRLRQGKVDLVTDAVIFPRSEGEIGEILRWAARCDVSVIPFGGGTSVVGGVERHPLSSRTVTVTLENLSRVLEIDRTSLTARCEAGIRGPELERRLAGAGFSLGHFPQSFEYSTLGGWIATRGAGQASTRYGKIEDMVSSVRLVTADGVMEVGSFPAQATGSDLSEVVVGSEGTLGIISEAVMRIHPVPALTDVRGYLFEDFARGVEAVREILQAGVRPAVVRLSDEPETAVSLKLREFERGGRDFKENVGKFYLKLRGRSWERGSLLIMGCEGNRREVRYERLAAEEIIGDRGGISLGKGPGKAWTRRRFRHPYLRDEFISMGLLIDTLETSTSWSNLLPLYRAVVDRFEAIFTRLETKGLLLSHLSHAYADGASLYFTFLTPARRDREIDVWEQIKEGALDAIISNGGSLSHHHGIGKDHARWMKSFLGEKPLNMMAGLKRRVDPWSIMNPGAILDPVWTAQETHPSGQGRAAHRRRLDTGTFDLLVIGGGITGGGIAWDAALRGLKVALLEKDDFGSGTSSRSSKMVHGGLRYLKQLNVKLVRESLHERGLLLKLAPHLVHPQTHVIPIYGRSAAKMMELRIGLTGYDILAGKMNIARHEKLSREEMLRRIPYLKEQGLQGGFLYHDCLVNDSRLTLAVVLAASQAGAVITNYVRAQGFDWDDPHGPKVRFRDELSGDPGTVQASVVVSAAGPWTDEVRRLAGEEGDLLRPTKGVHLVFKREKIPTDDVVVLFAFDRRPLYVVPVGDCFFAGTTDTDYSGDLDDVRATRDDWQYILNTLDNYFPGAAVGPEDVIGSWAGVRPLVAMEGSPSEVSRDYTVDHPRDGLVVVAGGKLTTFRSMAEDVVDDIVHRYGRRLGWKLKPCQTRTTPLEGGDVGDFFSYRRRVMEDLSRGWPLDAASRERLLGTYGTRFLGVLGYGVHDPVWFKDLHGASGTILGEILYSMDYEMAVTLQDIMDRRTSLRHFSRDHGLAAVRRIARVMGSRLGWSFSEIQDQVNRYSESVQQAERWEGANDHS